MATDLTPQELQELQELEELARLEKQFGGVPEDDTTTPSDITPTVGGPAQTALESFGETATFGYLPQLQAATEKGISSLSGLLGIGPAAEDIALKEQGFKLPEDPTYAQMRDENIARQELQAQENPEAAGGGRVAGAIVGAPLPGAAAGKLGLKGLQKLLSGANITKAARAGKIGGLGGTLAQGALTGAALGAAYNPGDVQGEVLDPEKELIGRLQGAVTGGAGGAIAGSAAGALGKSRRINKALNLVSNESSLAKKVGSEVDTVIKNLDPKIIAPAIKKAEQAVGDIRIPIDTTQLRRVDSPKVQKIVEAAKQAAKERGDTPSLPGKQALFLRRKLDRMANIPQSAVHARSVGGTQPIRGAADTLRNEIRKASPKAAEELRAAEEGIKLKQFLRGLSGKRPLEAIKAPLGSTKGSDLSRIDELVGSELRPLGEDIQLASQLQSGPKSLSKGEIINSIVQTGLKTGIKGTNLLGLPQLTESSQIPLNTILNELRRKGE